ncbi:MAG: histidinol dehydrogenase [Bacteroidota bacterium]
MKTYSYSELTVQEQNQLLKRPKIDFDAIFETVLPIINKVEQEGDEAVKAYTRQFDSVDLDTVILQPTELNVQLDPDLQASIDVAFDNIKRFHEAQLSPDIELETMPGVRCFREVRAIERVGLYVPGGTAILPSTAMMLAIPAMIAGCATIVMATPPNSSGTVPDEIVYIAQKAGVDFILLAGGAQAVAAMALGTQSVPKVDKIFGPGNQYVTAAKMILQNSEAQISIDMPAGPSEVLVIADSMAVPAYVAADLLSQAEHGTDSQVVLVATSDFDFDRLEHALDSQLSALPRKEIAEGALKNSFIIKVDALDDAFAFSNAYAPEHLIIQVAQASEVAHLIEHAGSVFLGSFTPESVGDYASGTNHTLPTYGYSRMYSGVSLSSFQKTITFQELTTEGLKALGPHVEKLAEAEGLFAHKNAVTIRLKDL